MLVYKEIVVLVTDVIGEYIPVRCDCYEYHGQLMKMKGGPSKEEQARQDQIQQSQLALQAQNLAMQQQQFGLVDPTITEMIKNGGLTAPQEAAVRANTINALPQQYQNLYGQIAQNLVARGVTGGQNAGAGDIARQYGSLGAQEAGQAQQGEFNIANLKQQGLLGAMNTALGIGGQYGQNVGTFGSGSSAAGSSATSAANAATQAQSGFWGSLFGSLASPFRINI